MILIKKDDHELQVSKETYENMFKELGYKIVNTKKTKKVEKNENKDNKEEAKNQEEKETKIDKFLNDVCDEEKDNKEEAKIDDILSVMSNNKNKQK